jgi:DNA adenine methylase
MPVKRPMLKYHGGKWMIAPWILSHMPSHKLYCEPFGGGGSVLLRKNRVHEEVYNDLDGEIVNLFCVVRDNGEELRKKLELTPYSRAEFNLSYEPADDPIEQARRTIVRSFMGRNPSSATWAKSTFKNKQINSYITIAHVWMKYPDALASITERLRGVIIENDNALDVIKRYDSPDTAFYVDPPYLPSTRDAGEDYRFEMSEDDHVKLAEVLNSVEGKVILSGYPSELYAELYKGWEKVDKESIADGHKPRIESLWLRNIEISIFDL